MNIWNLKSHESKESNGNVDSDAIRQGDSICSDWVQISEPDYIKISSGFYYFCYPEQLT